MMRNARDERGDKIFASSEYMRKEQIASFFSRLCSQKRKGLPLRSKEEWDEDAVDVDYEEELEQECEIAEMVDALRVAQENLTITAKDSDTSDITEQQETSAPTVESDNVTGPQDPLPPTAESSSKIQTKSDLPTQVKKIYGDGRCLFRSVAVACDMVLLSCARNEGRWPKDSDLAKRETEFADKSRKKTVDLWRANKSIYESHVHDLGLDHFWMDDGYGNIDKRISEMAKPKTFAGEAELLALVHVIERPIAVHYQNAPHRSLQLGEAYTGSANTVHLLNYPDDQDNPGHYDLLLHGDSDVNTSEIPKPGSYVIIRQGKQRWYPGLITNVDSDANEVEVKFMYPSGKKRNKFNFGTADPIWCTAKNIILICEAPTCDNRELYSLTNETIHKVDMLM